MRRRSALKMMAGVAAGLVAAGSMGLPAWAATTWTPLIAPAALQALLGEDDLAIIDIRGKAMDGDFAAGHIPGAVWSSYPADWRRADVAVDATPSAAELGERIASLGVSNRTRVVIVSAGGSATDFGGAARVYWSLKYAGHDDVAILDGGWAAWAEAGYGAETGVTAPVQAAFAVRLREELLASTERVSMSVASGAVLVDARSAEHYGGQSKSLAVAAAGHIPGALNLDSDDLFDAEANRLRPADQLAALLPRAIKDRSAEIIAYCNGGHLSATDWFVLHELLGFSNAALYVDSMVGWTADPARPVVAGD